MKHARTDANYAILIKRVKLQHEKKLVPNLLSMQSVDFEQTLMNLLRFLFCKNNFFTEKKNIVEAISVAITDSSMCNVLTCI